MLALGPAMGALRRMTRASQAPNKHSLGAATTELVRVELGRRHALMATRESERFQTARLVVFLKIIDQL
jgi:hypothetical protein